MLKNIILFLAFSAYVNAQNSNEISSVHEEIIKNFEETQKQIDKIFEMQHKHMIAMQKELAKMDKKTNRNSATLKQEEQCKYILTLGEFKKEDIKIYIEDKMMIITGKHGKENMSFYYSTSINSQCQEVPNVKFEKKSITIDLS